MDAALLHSLLEANCSLELAEELVLDGWGLPLHPEGRREASRPGRRGLLVWRVECARSPRSSALRPASCGAPRTPAAPLIPAPLSPVTRSLLLLQHDLGPDRDVLAPERGRSPGGEAVPRVLQRSQVQHDP
ncbi:CRHR2 [Cervus elaphus hippelaphus]|uniref:CRHR2 n=1 Tax=Cervus elaphus hippelaphus TaxID=46360 RepID=A0A212CKW5_CEREH|nr:CRHR2 [Cervus elaphus hippelaphus]